MMAGALAGLEPGGERSEGGDAEGAEEGGRVGRGAQAGQDLERGQGAQQFGLGPVVDVVAGRVAGGQASLVLGPEADLGLSAGGMHLDGQGLLGGQHLEQEGQPGAEAGHAPRPELAVRVGGDDGVQGGPGRTGGGGRVGTQPQLGLGALSRDRAALQVGDPVPRAPRVGADYRLE